MSPLVSLPGGQLRDEIRNPVYDTIDIAAAESPIAIRRFYSAVQGKALSLTNLRQNNLLETAVSFRVQGLAIDAQNFYSANRSVLPLVMESSSIQLNVGEKIYFQSPFTLCGGRLENWDAVSRSSGTGEAAGTLVQTSYQHFGQAAVAPVVLTGKHVIDILPLQSFSATWDCNGMTAAEITAATPAASTKVRFIFSLKGLLRRPVQ